MMIDMERGRLERVKRKSLVELHLFCLFARKDEEETHTL